MDAWSRRDLARWYREWALLAGGPESREQRNALAAYLERLADKEEAEPADAERSKGQAPQDAGLRRSAASAFALDQRWHGG